jgi:hypothetical protein
LTLIGMALLEEARTIIAVHDEALRRLGIADKATPPSSSSAPPTTRRTTFSRPWWKNSPVRRPAWK